MKSQNSPQGKVFRFQRKDLWPDDIRKDFLEPKFVLAHMVLVVSKSNGRPGWVKVATVLAHPLSDFERHPNLERYISNNND